MISSSKNERHSANHRDFGARLTAAREAVGLSKPDLARRMGCGTSTVSAWEAGRSRPRTNTLLTLAGLVSVSPTWLLSGLGDGPMSVSPEMRMEALGNGIVELRQLSSRIAQQLEDLEHRFAVLKKPA